MSARQSQPEPVGTLRRRAEFLRAQAGQKAVRAAFILRARQRKSCETGDGATPRTGLTVTKKTGGAVQRNRIKRRLRHALRALHPATFQPGYDYVIIARTGALTHPFDALAKDLESAIVSVHRNRQAARKAPATEAMKSPG